MKRLLCILSVLVLFPCLHAQSKRALLIGISEYTKSQFPNIREWENIHGANDVRLIAPVLTEQGFIVDTLTDTDATANKIREMLKDLENKSEAGDIVFIHFSGHGQPVEDADRDEKDGWDESIIPVDAQKKYVKGGYEGENHILDDELNIIFTEIRRKTGPKGFVYVILDACHAGTSSRAYDEEEFIRGTTEGFGPNGKYFTRPDSSKRTAQNFKISKNKKFADICILEACRADEYNREIRRKGIYYGPLSFYLVKAIQDKILGKDVGWIDLVKDAFFKDSALQGEQNIVIESSLE